MLVFESKLQVKVLLVAEAASVASVSENRPTKAALPRLRPATVPVAATVKLVVTSVVRSTSPRVRVPEAVREARLLSTIVSAALSVPTSLIVGASLTAVTSKLTVFVTLFMPSVVT